MNITIVPRTWRAGSILTWLVSTALLMLLISNLPLFLCTRLRGDAVYYDLQVAAIREGGVLYRDLLEPNFPGVVWIHWLVRGIAGNSSVALRLFDFLVLSGIAAILAWRNKRDGGRGRPLSTACLALSICWFYLSLSVMSQCQRDLWMLLPALAALSLRYRSGRAIKACRSEFVPSILEGLLWGSAIWIKPHVIVPMACVIGARTLSIRRPMALARTAGGLLVGGLFMGVAGSLWLVQTGAWHHFWEMQLHWNPEYLATRSEWNSVDRCFSLFQILAPWSLAHLLAVPVALRGIWREVLRPLLQGERNECPLEWPTSLKALYLGWLLQAIFLQHPFAYTHIPAIILALAVVASVKCQPPWQLMLTCSTVAIFASATVTSPCLRFDRLEAWPDCFRYGPSIEIQNKIETHADDYWRDYPDLVRFLQRQSLDDGQLLVYSHTLVSLYRDLQIRPPTRYALTDVHAAFFRSRVGEIAASIQSSPHRLVVSDLRNLGISDSSLTAIDPATGLPLAYPANSLHRFPATQPVVFRSGWFVVHQAKHPIGPLETE